jgi:hypothetical protein
MVAMLRESCCIAYLAVYLKEGSRFASKSRAVLFMSATYTKIRLPETDDGDRAFMELARRHHVVGIRDDGHSVVRVPSDALRTLDQLSLPYEILAVDLPAPARPAAMK